MQRVHRTVNGISTTNRSRVSNGTKLLTGIDLNESIRLDPTSAFALTNRGRVYAFKCDLDRAIDDYDEAVRINPAFALASLQYDPADAYSWNNRGQARMRLGNKAGAIADFRKALEISPGLRSASESLQRLGAVQ
jgi:tetratricopeptide (TPR) repeat protein